MRFDFITIFPQIFDGYLGTSILRRAAEKKLVSFHTHDLRKWTTDKHRTVDDKPYGGGAGMVLAALPILKAVEAVRKEARKKKTKVIVFSAKGKPFNQKLAYDWTKKYDQLILISGRYEGIDERIVKILHAEEISIGPYVLTDGDVAAMVIASAVTRLLPGAIRLESLQEESFSTTTSYKLPPNERAQSEVYFQIAKRGREATSKAKLPATSSKEYPHYTRPEVLTFRGKKYRVPKVLLSGDHKKIIAWRRKATRS